MQTLRSHRGLMLTTLRTQGDQAFEVNAAASPWPYADEAANAR